MDSSSISCYAKHAISQNKIYHHVSHYQSDTCECSFSLCTEGKINLYISVDMLTILLAPTLIVHPALNPGLVGLALTYVVSLGVMLQFCIRQSAEVENVVSSYIYI